MTFYTPNVILVITIYTYDIYAYKQIIKPDAKMVIIDEIHLLSDPGRCAKIIHDQLPDINLVISDKTSLVGAEIKFGGGAMNKAFGNRYPNAETVVVTTENFY